MPAWIISILKWGGIALAVGTVVDAPPEVEIVEGYWFAWAAFPPETSVFTARGPP